MYPDPTYLIAATFDGNQQDRRNFRVQIYTRNGHEELKVLAARIAKPNAWRFAYKFEGKQLLGKHYPDFEKYDPDFPLAQGSVPWR
jgi:hypothetical protein